MKYYDMNWYKTSQQAQIAPTTPVKPDLVTTPSEIEDAKGFTEHLVIYRFKNGWTVQKVEKDEELEGNFISTNSYADDNKFEHIYSLRNEYNVPRADFVATLSKKDPGYFGIREVKYKYISEQKFDNQKHCDGLLKEFFDYLKNLGMKPKWIEEPDYLQHETIKIENLGEFLVDDMGLSLAGVVAGEYSGDSDSYSKALEEAYNESFGGSYYYKNKANELIDSIFNLAEAREEAGLLEGAVQSFEKWAFDAYVEVDWGDALPERPEEPTKEEFTRTYKETPGQQEFKTKGFEKTKKPYFDKKAYEEAVKEYERLNKEYEEKETELQDYFEPYQFGNMAYKKLQELKAKLPPSKTQKTKSKKSKK